MSITATFYTFSKKTNSTKLVNVSGTNISINIKDPCDILNPIIFIEHTNPIAFNYCHISRFNRYYFISNWESDHGFWIASLKVDVLATYKNEFITSSQYCFRASTPAESGVTSVNTFIPDSEYPLTKQTDVEVTNLGTPFDSVDDTLGDLPTFVIALVNNSDIASSKINGIQYLQLTRGQARELMRVIFSQDYFGLGPAEALFGITTAVIKSVVNPAQYISSSYVLPFKCEGSTRPFPKVTVPDLKLGWWDVPFSPPGTMFAISGADNNVPVCTKYIEFNIQQHPQVNSHGSYLNYSPYTEATLFAGPFGNIPINIPSIGSGIIPIKARLICDFQGNAQLIIKHILNSSDFDSDDNVILATRRTNIAIEIPMIATKTNTQKALTESAGIAVGGIATGGTSLALSGGGIVDCISSMAPKYYQLGGQGCDAFIRDPWYIQVEHHHVAGEFSAGNLIGKPLCDTRILNQLSGYTMVHKPNISISGTYSECEEIKTHMIGGFFIE